jgi:nicotinate-nucleotide adenylyltransferase
MTRRIGLLGGTFDPVHYGHLDAADAARAALRLDEVLVIPSHVPPHRPAQPHASVFHRFAMLALAVQGRPYVRLSDTELAREGPSFTVDTLRRLHESGLRPLQLFFILGADAFAEIATWRAFPAVLDAANFAVIARPGTSLDDAMTRNAGVVGRVLLDPADMRHDVGRVLLDPAEPKTGIYPVEAQTRDVSSTAIRERIAARVPIDECVPGPVAAYITAQGLYRTVDGLHG